VTALQAIAALAHTLGEREVPDDFMKRLRR
jgi:hypothetical protein